MCFLCSSTSLKVFCFTLNKLLALLSLIDSLYLVLRCTIHAKLMSLAEPFVSPLLQENMLFLNEM